MSPRPKTLVPPVDHALKVSLLQADRALRVADAAFNAARAFAQRPGEARWEELWAIGEAARRRLEDLQKGWVDSWFAWARYSWQIQDASTLSKLSERELNIVNQAAQLVSDQSVSLLSLMENIEVDVLHWMTAEPAGAPPTPLAHAKPARTAIAAE